MSSMETYFGHVRTPQDAIILFEACRLGLLPRVQRRLSEKERQQIKSGSVFVWDEREAGMRRWTDGKSWSASRVSGSFLTYREMEGKRGGFTPTPNTNSKKLPGINNKTLEGGKPASSDSDPGEGDDGPDGYRYKPDGLMKQSFSITTQDGRHLHLISYYSRAANSPALQQPSTDPALRNIRPQKGMYPEATLNEANSIPAVTRGPLGASQWSSAPSEAPPYPYPHSHPHYMPSYPPAGYPPGSWPPSPAGTPVHYPYYPHGHPYAYPPPPGHPGSPYPPPPPHHHYPPSSHSPQPHYERQHLPSAGTSTTLPPIINGNNTSSPHVPLAQSPRMPPPGYGSSQPTGPVPASALRPNPYTASSMESKRSNSVSAESGSHQQPTSSGQSTPAPSNGHGNSPPVRLHTDPAPLRDLPTTTGNGASTPTKTTIPSIGSLLSRDDPIGVSDGRENGGRDGRGRSRTPPGIVRGPRRAREVADPVKASGFERDRSDLKRLDTQALKF